VADREAEFDKPLGFNRSTPVSEIGFAIEGRLSGLSLASHCGKSDAA
jgi:hypothetical protein